MPRAVAATVVVVAAIASVLTSTACAPAPLEPGLCEPYAACFFKADASALRELATNEDPALSCYDNLEGADDVIAAMVDAYSPGGLCFRGGLSGEGADEKAAVACRTYCEDELKADCRRAREGGLAVCDDACDTLVEDAADKEVVLDIDDELSTFPVCPVPP